MNPSSPSPVTPRQMSEDGPDFPDLRWLLIVMGVLIWLAALGCGGLGFYYAFALPKILGQNMDDPGNISLMMSGTGWSMFLTAAAMVILGWGSIRTRKWAGNILYALGWALAVLGAVTTVFVLFTAIPAMLGGVSAVSTTPSAPGTTPTPPPSPGMLGGSEMVFIIIGFAFMLGIYLLPAAMLIVIYGLRNVRFTFQYHQKGPNWTDNIPVPILAWWTMIIWGVIYAVPNLPATVYSFQTMGVMEVSALGWTVAIVLTGLTVAMAYVVLQLRPWAWWFMTGLTLLGALLTGIYMATVDPMAAMQMEDMSPEEQAMIEQQLAFYDSSMVWVIMGVTFAAIAGFLYWIRRFYFPKPDAPNEAPQPA